MSDQKETRAILHFPNIGYASDFRGMVEEAYLGPDEVHKEARAIFEAFFRDRDIPIPTSIDDLRWSEKTTLLVDLSNPRQATLIMAAVCRALQKYALLHNFVPIP